MGRVKSSIRLTDSTFDSEFAEIAMYRSLMTIGPVPNYTDLYSVNQLGQEFHVFDALFHQDEQPYGIQLGNEITWQVIGGTNFWSDYADRYIIKTAIEPETRTLQITPSDIKTSKFGMKVKCLGSDLTQTTSAKVSMT